MEHQKQYKLLFVWQSLVVPNYRSFFHELAKQPNIRIGLVAPPIFKELGSQEIPFAPQSAEDQAIDWHMLKASCYHTQIVWYHGLSRAIKEFFGDCKGQNSNEERFVISMAEPYSPTSFGVFQQAKKAIGAKNFKFGTFALQNINKKLSLPIKMIEQRNFLNCDLILALGKEHTEVLRSHGYYKPVIEFPLWYDQNVFAKSPRWQALENLNKAGHQLKTSSKMTLGYVGTISTAKGVFDLIEALAQEADSLKNSVRLFLGGHGPERAKLEYQLAALKADGWETDYLGPVPGDKMTAFYGSLDVLVVPSKTTPNWKEQFGRVIIEANAMGVPVIGSNSGEIPNITANKELVFHEGRVDELGKRIHHCLALYTSEQKWQALQDATSAAAQIYTATNTATAFANSIKEFKAQI